MKDGYDPVREGFAGGISNGYGDGISGHDDGIEGGGLCLDAFPPILDAGDSTGI